MAFSMEAFIIGLNTSPEPCRHHTQHRTSVLSHLHVEPNETPCTKTVETYLPGGLFPDLFSCFFGHRASTLSRFGHPQSGQRLARCPGPRPRPRPRASRKRRAGHFASIGYYKRYSLKGCYTEKGIINGTIRYCKW